MPRPPTQEQGKDSAQGAADPDLEQVLTPLLADILKPDVVRGLVFTGSNGMTVRGIVLTSCTKEGRMSSSDFEVRFAGPNSGLITKVSVKAAGCLPREVKVGTR